MMTARFIDALTRALFLGESDPWTTPWLIAPINVPETSIAPDDNWNPAWEALPRKPLSNWTVVPYGDPGDPPPPAEVLPYAWTTPPGDWENTTGVAVTIAALAVIAWNPAASGYDLLFTRAVDPAITVAAGETFALTALEFEFAELGDL